MNHPLPTASARRTSQNTLLRDMCHILWTSHPSIPLSSHKWGRIPHAKYSRSNAWELTRARMVMLSQVEEEDSVCGMFWRSDARISNRQIRRSATYLFMFLDSHQSLKAFRNYQSSQTADLLAWKKTSKMVSTPVTASSSGRLLEACQGPTTCHLHHSRHVRGQPLRVVETTRTSLPDAVAARASLLGHPRYVVPC
jgi:hypothetical protein